MFCFQVGCCSIGVTFYINLKGGLYIKYTCPTIMSRVHNVTCALDNVTHSISETVSILCSS